MTSLRDIGRTALGALGRDRRPATSEAAVVVDAHEPGPGLELEVGPSEAQCHDVVALLGAEHRATVAGIIAGAAAGKAEEAAQLAHLVLLHAQRSQTSTSALLSTLAVVERYEFLRSSHSLYLNLGNYLIDNGAFEPALMCYLRATEGHTDNKWHAGQKLLDHIVANKPDATEISMLAAALESAKDFHVPDLFRFVLQRAVELPDFDLQPLHWMASSIGWGKVSDIGNKALAAGRHGQAMRAYDLATVVEPDEIGLRLQMGITQFLAGKYGEAEREWALTEYLRSQSRQRLGIDNRKLRFLGKSWFAAIGHVAHIDTYIKSMELGWRPRVRTAYLFEQARPPPGASLMRRWSRFIEVHMVSKDPAAIAAELIDYPNDKEEDQRFAALRQESLTDEFWYGPDEGGRTRWYAPLGADVERAWKAAGRGPLLTISEEERISTRKMMAQVFGLPEDAWFVALHVREPGFHASWHRAHPGTRHADIASYERVIDLVTRAGGWVVRVGDRSMSPLKPRPQVIDYATTSYRNFDLDVFLCGTCAYFIGTNSGLSLVPPLFGRRCVLTNWSPIAIPNWYLDDIYIPKLVRNEKDGRHLSFREMFGSTAGWTQWRRDYPEGVTAIEDNTADDLVDAVAELHAEVIDDQRPSADDLALVERFNAQAIAGGSYVGSRIGTRFLRKHAHLL